MRRLILLTLLLSPLFVFAQSGFLPDGTLPYGIKEQVSVTVNPSLPGPGEKFNVRVESFSTDLNKALITWTVDGSNVLSGRGVTTYEGVAPSNGSVMNIKVTMVKSNGIELVETIRIAPVEVNLVYEAKTYTHPFYKGKALYTNESIVRIVAFPNFSSSNGNIKDEELIYTWKIDKKVMQSQSGYGKNYIDYKGKLIERPIEVEVLVESVDKNLVAKNKITLSTFNPQVVLYQDHPLTGTLFEYNLNNKLFTLDSDEIEVTAKPFFFSTSRDEVSNVDYSWNLNGKNVFNLSRENSVLFRKEDGASGIANLNVSIKHDDNILQYNRTSTRFDMESNDLEDFEF